MYLDWQGGLLSPLTWFCFFRSMDVVSPALHDLHYQPMVYDLLPVKDDVYDFQGSKMILGENDFLWNDFRHLHIGECSSKWTGGVQAGGFDRTIR